MPLYLFECPRCLNRQEIQLPLQHISPICCIEVDGHYCGTEMQKIISGTSFVLKGSGWAKDGYSGGGGQ